MKGEPLESGKKEKKRLDVFLVEQGHTKSREQARGLILGGKVFIDNNPVTKAGYPIKGTEQITVKQKENPFVSRGGTKLEGALDDFKVDPVGQIAMDVGASTGGFTDCLLRQGAEKVYAIDVGYGQFDWKLRNDPRVILFERTNIRKLTPTEIPEKIDLAVIDVSFISLKLVLPPVLPFLKPGGRILALIKPQFEVGKGQVGKNGVVKDPEKHKKVISEIKEFCVESHLEVIGVITSKLKGPKGNTEFFINVKK